MREEALASSLFLCVVISKVFEMGIFIIEDKTCQIIEIHKIVPICITEDVNYVY
jgi:hypothetical protein